MLKAVILLVVFVLCVYAGRYDCNARKRCRPGMRCIDGTCVYRPDCPHLKFPTMVRPGCWVGKVIDNRGCPRMKTFCGNF
ncbi:hypothetical protein Y032_0102g3505 [Ancylostoma ceylanicum]|uniref:Uncharacterized protein n=1 Tax=Ancylostoma ceylanicum TaxID=53326 RepID=A0A016THD6_9BILA|nr:hypothetical protein Y032_0102g3505 [Ancylostoma ceylanicum]